MVLRLRYTARADTDRAPSELIVLAGSDRYPVKIRSLDQLAEACR